MPPTYNISGIWTSQMNMVYLLCYHTQVAYTQIASPLWSLAGFVRANLGIMEFAWARASPVDSQSGPAWACPGSAHGMGLSFTSWCDQGLPEACPGNGLGCPCPYFLFRVPIVARTNPAWDQSGLALWVIVILNTGFCICVLGTNSRVLIMSSSHAHLAFLRLWSSKVWVFSPR